MKPRVFRRAGWWRQVGPGLTMHAAPTIPLLSVTITKGDDDPWLKDGDVA
jgi:hypothetical protein